MSKITHINGKRTPVILANELDWSKMERCIVISEEGEDIFFNFSDMTWRDRTLLSAALQNLIVRLDNSA